MSFRSKVATVLFALMVGVGSFFALQFLQTEEEHAVDPTAQILQTSADPGALPINHNSTNRADDGADISVLKGVKALVYKSPSCGCCKSWEKYLEANGMNVESVPVEDLNKVKAELGVPEDLSSCHTAVIEGYVVEGHVPMSAIAKMIQQKLQIKGIAVPGMPIGSPGMEGFPVENYNVISFTAERAGQPGPREVILSQ